MHAGGRPWRGPAAFDHTCYNPMMTEAQRLFFLIGSTATPVTSSKEGAGDKFEDLLAKGWQVQTIVPIGTGSGTACAYVTLRAPTQR